MSATGPPSMGFRSQPELRTLRTGCGDVDVARDNRSGRQAPAPFWTVPYSPSIDLPNKMESMYAGPPRGGGSMPHHHVSAEIASSLSVLEPLQRTETRSSSIYPHATGAAAAVAADPFPGLGFPEAGVRQLDRSGPGSNPFRVGSDVRSNPHRLGNVNVPSHGIVETSALGFTPANQTWEGILGTAFAPRTHPSQSSQIRLREPSELTRTQLSSTGNDTSSVEPAQQSVDDDISDDVYTFLCEWTDEHGTCNMDILGDRVWMSHHLSRHHNVVGHEKSQRVCLWRGCTDTMNKGSLARHVVSRHLRAGASCEFCSKMYSRADVARRHTKKCKVANGALVQRDQTKW